MSDEKENITDVSFLVIYLTIHAFFI